MLKANTPAGQSKTPNSAATQEDGIKEVRRRKWHSTNKTSPTSKKVVLTTVSAVIDTPLKEVATQNFFALLQACDMDMDSANTELSPREAAAPAKIGRLPPVVLTSAVNLSQLQKQLKCAASENFKFRNTRNGTRVIMRSMADFQSIKSHFDRQNLSYYYSAKSEKRIKAVIRHLLQDAPAEDISDELVSLGFDVVSVKQMTAACRSPPEESKIINLPLFLVTLPRTAKSQEIFICQASATLLSGWRLLEPRMLLLSATTASSSAISGLIANKLPAVCGAKAHTCTGTAQRRETLLPHQYSVTPS
jgi:hypothetical protein